ncbi:MAG TPA: hypothetical protein VHA33_16980 [Candidatus Angelobacter sp.]|jgi:hypothetical protein|nr:hypothetical protein [Candidatus Angelobacter sp.]
MIQPRNIIFWGAGATKALGIRITADQTKFIKLISDDNDAKQLPQRIREALDHNDAEPWHSALFDLITILGDTKEAYGSIHRIDDFQRDAMRRNWHKEALDAELDRRIIELRLIYDWPALKSVVRVCPGSSQGTFKINDLFNLLDMHIPPGFGFRAPISQDSGELEDQVEERPFQFFDARRLIGAKNALLMLLISLFYIDYQQCIRTKRPILQKYYDFANALGRRMQKQAFDLARPGELDRPRFYKGDVSVVSINYDPIALWMHFNAHRDLNKSASVPHIGSPAVPLEIFTDYGPLIPSRRIEKGESDWPWYAMNEAVVQRLNEQRAGDTRVRLLKLLFPHGCLCWRECPDCGKLSAYHGDQWILESPSLFPPPPLRAFDDKECPARISEKERKQRERGKVDARQCLHCSTLTYAHHTQAIMQSSFKPRPPSFIEEIDRDLRATTMQADHIIFMGYSLPPDDVTYRAFFSARRRRSEDPGSPPVQCTVVGWSHNNPGWYRPMELKTIIRDFPQDFPEDLGVRAARDIFGEDNVRFYGGGVPNVFCDGDQVTEAALERLLNWSE